MSRRESGFTIVETLIVLAAGSLILLIVFLAIPSLLRNSHNNQRRQDVQIVLQDVSHYELNNSGTIPNTGQLQSFLDTYEKSKLTFYDISDITVSTPVASDTPQTYPSSPVGENQMLINNHAKCQTGGSASNHGAGYSDVVALYVIETASGTAPQCQQL